MVGHRKNKINKNFNYPTPGKREVKTQGKLRWEIEISEQKWGRKIRLHP